MLLPTNVMKCSRCKSAMKEMKRSFHKRRKWVCPKCGRIRFQEMKQRTKK